MSVTISYRPTEKGTSIAGGSNLHRALDGAFGEFPMTLGHGDIERLWGIHYAGETGASELITAIEKYGEIEVMARW